jgi:hypothetical protein
LPSTERGTCGEAKAVGLRAFLSDATLDLMAERGTYFDPNLLVLHNYLDNRSGFTFAEEFVYRVQDAHETPMDALMSATSISAESLGLGSTIGKGGNVYQNGPKGMP